MDIVINRRVLLYCGIVLILPLFHETFTNGFTQILTLQETRLRHRLFDGRSTPLESLGSVAGYAGVSIPAVVGWHVTSSPCLVRSMPAIFDGINTINKYY